jgi:hypothetical protein
LDPGFRRGDGFETFYETIDLNSSRLPLVEEDGISLLLWFFVFLLLLFIEDVKTAMSFLQKSAICQKISPCGRNDSGCVFQTLAKGFNSKVFFTFIKNS